MMTVLDLALGLAASLMLASITGAAGYFFGRVQGEGETLARVAMEARRNAE